MISLICHRLTFNFKQTFNFNCLSEILSAYVFILTQFDSLLLFVMHNYHFTSFNSFLFVGLFNIGPLVSQNDPPPPYSVSVHPQPPLKPYEEVVYGNAYSVPTYIHPHYIPQHAPVITTAVTQQSFRELFLFPFHTLFSILLFLVCSFYLLKKEQELNRNTQDLYS